MSVVALLILGDKLDIPLLMGIGLAIAVPLAVLWAIYGTVLFLIFIPLSGLYSLYSYLVGKDLPDTHAIVIAALTIIGALTLLLVFLSSN